MEGDSLVSASRNRDTQRQAIYWEHEGNRAVRVGKWKLVAKGKSGQDEVEWELYDIEADCSELHNLAPRLQERTKEMAALWRAYAERANVVPWPAATK